MKKHTIQLGIIVLGIMVLTIVSSNPSITGFVPTQAYSQNLDIYVTESQRFALNVLDNKEITSLAISGQVNGKGLANIYLTNGKTTQLIYTNKRREGSSMGKITGNVASEIIIEPKQKLNKIDKLVGGYSTNQGSFQNACIETCVTMLNSENLAMDIIMAPGMSVDITELTFTTS